MLNQADTPIPTTVIAKYNRENNGPNPITSFSPQWSQENFRLENLRLECVTSKSQTGHRSGFLVARDLEEGGLYGFSKIATCQITSATFQL